MHDHASFHMELDCFPLPFTKEGGDVIKACVRGYTYKGSS